MACEHCHNPESWAIDGGTPYTVRQVIRILKKPGPGKTPIRGVTFSGGEPFLQAGELAQVATQIRKLGWDVVTYSGYTYEDLSQRDNMDVQALLALTDYLIDGAYKHEQRDRNLMFRGSNNQRIIDMNATRDAGSVVIYDAIHSSKQ